MAWDSSHVFQMKVRHLEDCLASTEAAVQQQTEQVNAYRSAMEDAGLLSPQSPHSHSESNLQVLGGGQSESEPSLLLRAASSGSLQQRQEERDSEHGSNGAGSPAASLRSLSLARFKDYGNTNDATELKTQIGQLKDYLHSYNDVLSNLKGQLRRVSSVEMLALSKGVSGMRVRAGTDSELDSGTVRQLRQDDRLAEPASSQVWTNQETQKLSGDLEPVSLEARLLDNLMQQSTSEEAVGRQDNHPANNQEMEAKLQQEIVVLKNSLAESEAEKIVLRQQLVRLKSGNLPASEFQEMRQVSSTPVQAKNLGWKSCQR